MAKVNVNSFIAEAGKKLEQVGIEAGPAEVELILCDLLDVNRLQLFLNGPSLIDEKIRKKFDAVIKKRLTRYPLQYILGNAWFYGRKFLVNEDVMVPTPETELLLESILRSARLCASDPVRLLDVGVGSGVIAISAILENAELDVTAIDISAEALRVAQVNADRFGVADSIRFIHSDLFAALGDDERFDIIASNPPYISTGEYDELEPEVKADPPLALLAGPRGLDVISRLIAEAPDYMERPGVLMFEIGYNQVEEIFTLVDEDGRYAEYTLLKDLNDLDRLIICKIE